MAPFSVLGRGGGEQFECFKEEELWPLVSPPLAGLAFWIEVGSNMHLNPAGGRTSGHNSAVFGGRHSPYLVIQKRSKNRFSWMEDVSHVDGALFHFCMERLPQCAVPTDVLQLC